MAPLTRATRRANELNTLTCNVGLELKVYVDLYTGALKWVIYLYEDGPGSALIGMTQDYKHERSAVRALWRMYRQHTGD